MMETLGRSFYDRDTLTVARELLGCRLVRELDGRRLVGTITETEAYIGRCDKACHAYGYRRTARTETLFGAPGTAYIYLIYGMYCCLNLVTEPEGEPAAVLIRGIAPLEGAEEMAQLRFKVGADRLTAAQRRSFLNGPGKVCKALSLDRRLNGHDLETPPLYVLPGTGETGPVHCGERVGIDYAEEAVHFPWRFWIDV